MSSRYARSEDLFRRATRVIPGGIHLSGRPLGGADDSPLYMERGRGCTVWDVDGNEYIDLFMAFGPFLLGYAHPDVEGAVIRQLRNGHLLSMNHPLHVELIEKLVARFPGADMGVFFRSGSEATTAALRIARRATGRRRVARCGYHGWHDWCLPLEDFVPAGLDRQVVEFQASQPETLARAFAENPGEIAAVIVAPEMVIPTDAAPFVRIAEITRANGAVLVFDEVKTALRVAPGSIQQRVGVVPDLTTLSKALGNGWPVAAVIGRRSVMEHGAGMHYSGTYHGDTCGVAAALATLELVDELRVAEHVDRLGRRLIDGLNDLTRSHGVAAEAYGEPLPCMPFLRFSHPDDAIRTRAQATFYREVFERGVLLHPRHLWFLSHAHRDDDVARVLEACDHAFRAMVTAHPDAA